MHLPPGAALVALVLPKQDLAVAVVGQIAPRDQVRGVLEDGGVLDQVAPAGGVVAAFGRAGLEGCIGAAAETISNRQSETAIAA